MREELLRFLRCNNEMSITLCGQSVTMRILCAADMLALRHRIASLPGEDDAAHAIAANAQLLAAVLFLDDAPLFASGTEIMDILSAEEINRLTAIYADWNRLDNPSITDTQSADLLKKA